MIITINKNDYNVNESEFNKIPHRVYTNLNIKENVGVFERIASLLSELSSDLNISNAIFYQQTHGGFIPINCSAKIPNIYIVGKDGDHYQNIKDNIALQKLTNIHLSNSLIIETNFANNLIVYSDKFEDIDKEVITNFNPIILSSSPSLAEYEYSNIFHLSNTDLYLYIPNNAVSQFNQEFYYYILDDKLDYDNLNHLCIMVKNGGPQFEQMLLENMEQFDKWTILDTGSTDDTIEIINRVLVGKKKGQLFQEPFINFRDSRNRCLDLAGTSCKFITMLDDTYIINGNLRLFLNETRGDQLSSSFSIYIQSDGTIYSSNRITKSHYGLRYCYKIHEVIKDIDDINIVIPKEDTFIVDRQFIYMIKRTYERKQLDLKLLFEEVEENPFDPRAYYYIGQTYFYLQDYENAFSYYKKRVEITNAGYNQERVNALLELGQIANFKLNKPWDECEELYNRCYKADESRPEALYFIGVHYYNENNYKKAFGYFKKAFEIGFPLNSQFSLKPLLSYNLLPIFLCAICYDLNEYEIGLKAAELFLKNNKPNVISYPEIASWYKIYEKLCIPVEKCTPKVPVKPIFVFHADGGFSNWSGSSILTNGVGGSETYIIEHARYIQKSGLFNVYVFCNCLEEENFEGVIYKPLNNYYSFIKQNYIHSCIVSRYSEYLAVTINGYVENVYLVVHDLTPTCVIIPFKKKLKQIFCLTEWHVNFLISIFPSIKLITVPFYYGIDFDKFSIKNKDDLHLNIKEKYKFIYSSFPNRGLLQLLQMWPKIHEFQPQASLHIYSDINGKWANQVEGEMMKQIKQLITDYKADEHNMNIYCHGWVNKQTLADAWLTSDIWFYPCTFMETFCLTALEAALTKTLVITNNLAALQNTVGDRGVIITGDPKEEIWQKTALAEIKKYLDPENIYLKNELIQKNYEWASTLSWESQANKLLQEYILVNPLEYKGKYNWANDLPAGNKKYFLEAIDYFNNNFKQNGEQAKVLEVGTHTGISLINIVKLIPNSVGFGVDRWSNYIEDDQNKQVDKLDNMDNMDELGIEVSFYKNIETSGLKDRIQGIKGDSYEVLFKMAKEGEMFDFIYVNGSKNTFDCYSDLNLSWKLLAEGGVLAINHYSNNTEEIIIDSPFESVKHFLNKFQKDIKILHNGYRVFLQKSTLL